MDLLVRFSSSQPANLLKILIFLILGTGKTMLVKAVANATTASFIRVIGSEFVQKYLGEVRFSIPFSLNRGTVMD